MEIKQRIAFKFMLIKLIDSNDPQKESNYWIHCMAFGKKF